MSKTTLAALFALLGLGTLAVASCGGDGSTSTGPAPPPRMTTSSAVTVGGGGDGSGGASGSGGAGGMGNCSNAVLDGRETDVDCGGPDCGPCNDGLKCQKGPDCVSKDCDSLSRKCLAPTCKDGFLNGNETGIDCGGMCGGCGPSQPCKMNSDCKGASCVNLVCAPTCTDGVKNGNETDLDCGASCPPCDDGKACGMAKDCKSNQCNAGACAATACTDKTKNGAETDIDCGGGQCPQCTAAQKCKQSSDCVTGLCDAGTQKCACPTNMQPVPNQAGGAYCIDATEVTYAQYNPFWQAGPVNLKLPDGCVSGDYTPHGDFPSGVTPKAMQLPVSGVSWCQAVAFCLYSGKHLCGKVDGGPNDINDSADPAKSEWYNACSVQNANAYPYGVGYDNTQCDGVDMSDPATPAGTCGASGTIGSCGNKVGYDLTQPMTLVCQGGAPGVWGMSGNLAEWEDSCDSATAKCLVRGGSRCDKGADLACKAAVPRPRDYQGCDVGFRCCL